MIDSTPENAPEKALETPENTAPGEAASAPDEAVSRPGDAFSGTEENGTAEDAGAEFAVMTDMEEDGVALHIVEPHDPGTIMVAVAEPADMPHAEPAGGGASGVRSVHEPVIPQYGDLVDVAAVRLSGLGPALFFAANGVSCAPGDKVVVEMEEGQAFGEVASVMRMNPAHLEEASGEEGKIRPLVRVASEKDLAAAEGNCALATEALEYCRECVRDRKLDMKLVDVLILHDRGKMVFYFTAPARIDFRELVKDLVRRYRTRIELRQIGVRHETQMVGALGNCGMVCCCRRYLRKFAPVAIKMAKEQNVFLNPVKISGICGRLLCCLAYEQGHYDEFYRSCPKLGKKYHTDSGVFRVLRASLFRESVTVLSETGEELEYALTEWNAMNPFRPNAPSQQQPARKPERPEGDARPRKNDKRGGRPQPSAAQAVSAPSPASAPAPFDGRHDASPSGDDGNAPREISPDMPVRESVVIAAAEERTVVAEAGAVHVTESRSVAVFSESLRTGAPSGRSEPASFDDTDDAEDDGGSIFGLAPGRSATPAGQPGGQPAEGNGARDGGNRHKRPRRRKPRTSDS